MSLSPLYADAVAFAARCHDGQFRKSTEIPYIAHPLAVSVLVLEHGGDEEQAIAALLHDVIEDCGVSHREIGRRYGHRVERIVVGCTDRFADDHGPKPSWRQRKEAYLGHLLSCDADTLLVSICDKLHNAEAIGADLRKIGEVVYDRFTAKRDGTLWYYGALRYVFQRRLGAHPAAKRFNEAVRFMETFGTARGFRAA